MMKKILIITLIILLTTIILDYDLTTVNANVKDEFFIENWYIQVETDPVSNNNFFILALIDQESIENASYFDANTIIIFMYNNEVALSIHWHNELDSSLMTWIFDGEEVTHNDWSLFEDENIIYYSARQEKINNLIYELYKNENLSITVNTVNGEEKRTFNTNGLKEALSYINSNN